MTTLYNANDFNNYIQTVMSNDTLAVRLDGRTVLMLQADKLCHLRTYADDIALNGMIISLWTESGYLGTFICHRIDVYQEGEEFNVE